MLARIRPFGLNSLLVKKFEFEVNSSDMYVYPVNES